jgi:hypothetical protein
MGRIDAGQEMRAAALGLQSDCKSAIRTIWRPLLFVHAGYHSLRPKPVIQKIRCIFENSPIMKRFLTQLALLLTFYVSASCQKTHDSLDAQTKDAIDKIERIDAVYFPSEKSELWGLYLKFSHALTDRQLADLTNHWNPPARCYAFYTLAGRRSPLVDSILQTHLQDTTKVMVFIGDVGDYQTVNEFFQKVVTGHLSY